MNNKGHIIACILGIILIIASCSKVPKNILSEKDMQQIHADILMADAIISTEYATYTSDSLKLALYESVFRKHGITQELYDSSLVWYGKNLNIYMKVYDRMQVDINKRIHELGDIQADAAPSSDTDSANIWPRRSFIVFHPKSVFNGTTFDIKPDNYYPSGSIFVLGLNIWGLKEGMQHYPEVSINLAQRDTTFHIKETFSKDGYHEVILRSLPTRQVRRVYGYIRMEETDSTYHKIYVDSINLVRYNYGVDLSQKEGVEQVNNDIIVQ